MNRKCGMEFFSFEFSFSRKSNLKIFRTRVNLIQCPYEWIIDKGLCYVKKKNLEKNIFIFKALRSKSNFWIWKLFDLIRDFNSFLRIKKKRNSFLTTIFPNENLLSFEKFLKNDFSSEHIFDLLLHVKITSCLSRYLIYSIEPPHLSSNFVNFSNSAENLKLPLPFRKIPIIKLINSQE